MTSIYVHIPFCKQACTYCDFHFSTSLKLKTRLVDALVEEITQRSNEASGPVSTLYFGGGSPSILEEAELGKIIDAIASHYDLSQLTEVTLESNPDDHDSEKLRAWKSLGINRLSIGIQSFIDRDLRFMNRAHNAQQASSCVSKAREAGFESLTIDLIYGIPGQHQDEWEQNVAHAIELGTDHLSAYCLSVEERTALYKMVEDGSVREQSDDQVERAYHFLHHRMEAAGLEHYEISNFGRPGKRARHNQHYWDGTPYLGFGPGAHSFDGRNVRRWNISNNARYIKLVNTAEPYFETESLSEKERCNERLMTGLRKADGLDLDAELPDHRAQILDALKALPVPLHEAVRRHGNALSMDPLSWLQADAVIRALMID